MPAISLRPGSRALAPNASLLLMQPELACDVGLSSALIIQQLHYWLTSPSPIGKIINDQRWIYNSIDAWVENFKCRSKSTIKRGIKRLECLGVVLSGNFNKHKSNKTKWYTINYDRLKELFPTLFETLQSRSFVHEVKVNPSSVQNEPIYNRTKITAENTGLNNARARETSLPIAYLEKQPKDIQASDVQIHTSLEEPGVAVTGIPVTLKSATEDGQTEPLTPELKEALKSIDLISSKLGTPLQIKENSAIKAIGRLFKSHFGTGGTGLENFKKYCLDYSENPLTMGKKAMKSGDLFRTSIGSIFSVKTIEMWLEKRGFFNIYPPKQPKPQEENMSPKTEPVQTPFLSEMIVLEAAKDRTDESVKHYLYTTLGEVTYKSWFHNHGFVAIGMKNGDPQFTIKSNFARDYVTTHFREELKKAFVYAERVHGG